MPTKGKKKTNVEEQKEAPKEMQATRATQVVEIVENENPETAPAITPPESLESQEAPFEPIEQLGEVKEKVVTEERKQEIVEELFHPQEVQAMPEITMHRSQSPKKLFIWSIVLVITALAIGGGLIFATGKVPKLLFPIVSVKPTVIPTSSPIPTPTLEPLKKDSFIIEVINGGGVPGVAGKMKKVLEEKGYTVSGMSNAEEYTYIKTEILVKQGKEAYLALLEADLKDTYKLGTVSATLPSDSSSDAQVIVGK